MRDLRGSQEALENNITAGYSLRRLLSKPCKICKVRRESDNASMDITSETNIEKIIEFCNGTQKIVKLYNQASVDGEPSREYEDGGIKIPHTVDLTTVVKSGAFVTGRADNMDKDVTLSKSEISRLGVQLEEKSEEEKNEIIEKYIEAKLGGEIVEKALEDCILQHIQEQHKHPVGSIMMYHNGKLPDDNWLPCDGTNGTPDLRDPIERGFDMERIEFKKLYWYIMKIKE